MQEILYISGTFGPNTGSANEITILTWTIQAPTYSTYIATVWWDSYQNIGVTQNHGVLIHTGNKVANNAIISTLVNSRKAHTLPLRAKCLSPLIHTSSNGIQSQLGCSGFRILSLADLVSLWSHRLQSRTHFQFSKTVSVNATREFALCSKQAFCTQRDPSKALHTPLDLQITTIKGQQLWW